MSHNTAGASASQGASGSATEKLETPSLLDFSTLPPEALHAYVTTHNLAHAYPRPPLASPAPGSGEASASGTPEFADADAAAAYLGGLAGRHFTAAPAPKEGEVVVGFLLRCKVGDRALKIASV